MSLHVHLDGGTDLKGKELFGSSCTQALCATLFGKSDPYVILKYRGQSLESRDAKGQGSSPSWNQSFVFEVDEPDENDNMFIKVFDKDHFFGSDDFIGTAKVPLAGVFKNKHQDVNSYAVILPSGKAKGRIHLSMEYK